MKHTRTWGTLVNTEHFTEFIHMDVTQVLQFYSTSNNGMERMFCRDKKDSRSMHNITLYCPVAYIQYFYPRAGDGVGACL